MSGHRTPRRTSFTAAAPQLQLVPEVELEQMRCAWRSGLHELAVGRLLEHCAIQNRVIVAMAGRVEASGSEAEKARVAAAQEILDEDAPIHVRIEFDLATTSGGGYRLLLSAIREWTLEEIAALVDAAHVTATHRGEQESWETRLP